MVKMTFLYGHPTDPAAFEDYYVNNHLPLIERVPNVQRLEMARVVATPNGSEPPYYRITEAWFESVEQMQGVVSSEEGQAAVADLQNFATGGVTIFVSQVDE